MLRYQTRLRRAKNIIFIASNNFAAGRIFWLAGIFVPAAIFVLALNLLLAAI